LRTITLIAVLIFLDSRPDPKFQILHDLTFKLRQRRVSFVRLQRVVSY
jgi:hypothetical protein